ncbi:MAG TPA: PSD1 and planctomycete cytochrome C domain-containing protein, partial [Pirellulaceae bacterium]|nr:PSD1 and planctomycete cytochrome C domain-containing protein [Pirellulaceae bacterium]
MAIALIVSSAAIARSDDAPKDALTFEAQIAPLLQIRCVKCHGEGKVEAGFDVRRKFTLVKGGDSGPALIEGKPEESILWQRVDKGEMPPPDEGRLDDVQKSLLKRWIAAGAPVAKSPEPPLDDAEQPARFSDEDRKFWAFQPPNRAPVPTVRNVGRVRTPVDAFVLSRLEARELQFNPDADRAVLLRRLCFDLLGLPPTLEQLDDFNADDGPDAVERMVDRLLAAPAYGERWGRHWLDIAGYADSDGYLAADRLRPEAWRYRDYVIDAHNRDLPFDQFVREQLAGDELTDWRTSEQLSDEARRQLTATGFLRTASDPTYPGYTEPNEIHQVVSDTMQIVGSAFFGLTIHCARCHSHKFDPLSQRDYYSLQAIFLPALDPARWQPSEVRGIPLATDSELARMTAANQQVDAKVKSLNESLARLTDTYRRRLAEESLGDLGTPLVDSFEQPELSRAWHPSFAGTAKGWTATPRDGSLEVKAIDGGAGHAIVRLARPVLLAGEFESRFQFRWTSQDGEPKLNAAMQGASLNFRDAAGNLVASCGYIDENNTARGSPILGVSTAAEPLGADIVATYMKKFNQAVPPNERARALAPAGAATVNIRRDAAGRITVAFDDGKVHDELSVENRATITTVELEFRRFVLVPGATFDGLWAEQFELRPGAGSMVTPDDVAKIRDALLAPADKRTPEQKQIIEQRAPRLTLGETELSARFDDYRVEATRIKTESAAEARKKQDVVKLRGLIDLDGVTPPGRILRRGDYNKPGGTVEPNVPEVLADVGFQLKPTPTTKSSGRRAALAHWLTQAENPLLARVQMNRVWARHFGRALVPTQANFGRSGAKPSHPELLDWLATELPRDGWSLKRMHRRLTTSTVFRQSAALDSEQARRDGDNLLFGAWQPRRHEGEVLRDSVLSVAGKLQRAMGGKPSPVAPQADGSVVTADDAAGNRRSIYLIVRRSQHLTMFDLFDTPMMEVNCPERNTST